MKHKLKVVPFGGWPPQKEVTLVCQNCQRTLHLDRSSLRLLFDGVNIFNVELMDPVTYARHQKWKKCRVATAKPLYAIAGVPPAG